MVHFEDAGVAYAAVVCAIRLYCKSVFRYLCANALLTDPYTSYALAFVSLEENRSSSAWLLGCGIRFSFGERTFDAEQHVEHFFLLLVLSLLLFRKCVLYLAAKK